MAGRYEPYPEYKDSGVEWLGEVPNHWFAAPLKFQCTYNDEVLPEVSNDDYEIAYVDIGSVSASKGITKIESIPFGKAPSRARRIARDGDVIISTVRTYLKAIVAIKYPPDNLVVSTGFAVIRPRLCFHKKYAAYALRTKGFIEEVVARSVGISYPAINASDLVAIYSPQPHFEEQQTIANFLDHETGRIDGLIAKQQQLIGLLQEKRQAVISHAVTKGLNPAAPMRDSGVDWLGEVPAHWKIGKCGFYLTILSGFAFPSSGFTVDEKDTKLLRGINVGVSNLKWEETVYWRRSDNDGLDIYEMQAGTLIMGMDRPLISEGIRVAKVEAKDLPCLLLQRVAMLKAGEHIDTDYLFSLLSSKMIFEAHFSPDTTGVSVPHISPDQIKNFVIPIPSILEQNAISDFLRKQIAKIDDLIQQAENVITLLQERRTALISAAVTGKIDVRNWQPPTANQTSQEEAA